MRQLIMEDYFIEENKLTKHTRRRGLLPQNLN